jgi:hypothetical protein
MNRGRTVFAQLLDFLPKRELDRCVTRWRGNHRTKSFSCFDQFLALAFAQLTFRDSLRDIVTCLAAMRAKLYHAGFRGNVSRSTLADANERRDWRIYFDLAQALIGRARELYADEPFGVDLHQTVYAFDSTTIDLCLSLFPWAQFRRRKSAVKLHTLLDLRGNIPSFVHVSGGAMSDVRALDLLPLEAGAIYVLDRGYIDFARLHRFTGHGAFFIVRSRKRLDFASSGRRKVDKSTGVRSDNVIRLRGPKSRRLYPERLRRVSFYAEDIGTRLVFLTNNFTLPADVIAALYKQRWQVELFFKWIKQNLRIKAFYGTSPNAVKTQVWIAVCVYLLVAIARKELKVERSMTEMLQILSICLFERMPISTAFAAGPPQTETLNCRNQRLLFNL